MRAKIGSSCNITEGHCSHCGDPIPALRMAAVPNATECVTCKESLGDEPRIRRFDDYFGKEAEDVVETYYHRPNQYLAGHIARLHSPGMYSYDNIAGNFA